jgi:hypothetical protein
MLKPTFKKQQKSKKTLVFYFAIMVICYLLIAIFLYPTLTPDQEYIKYTNLGLFILTMILWVACWRRDPGYLDKDT